MRLAIVSAAFIGFASGAIACEGDIQGFWEKRPVGTDEPFQVIEEFRIVSSTGTLSICNSDRSFDAEFEDLGDKLQFGYARRMRVLERVGDDGFVTPTWIAEHQGVASEYRVRATK